MQFIASLLTRALAIVLKALDEESLLVDGVDGASDAVVIALELSNLDSMVLVVMVSQNGGHQDSQAKNDLSHFKSGKKERKFYKLTQPRLYDPISTV